MSDPEDGLQLSLPLAPVEAVAEIPSGELQRDGGSRPALILMAPDATTYYCKGPTLMPGHPFVAANEWLFAQLARFVGLPCRQTEMVRWHGALFAGNSILPNDRKMSGPLTAEAWGRMRNVPEVVYPLIVLDAWTVNTDRHAGNYLARVMGDGTGWFLANDHDMCLLPPGSASRDLVSRVDEPIGSAIVQLDFVRESVTDVRLMEENIARAEAVSNDTIRSLMSALPPEWMNDSDRDAIGRFLAHRRDRLKGLFTAAQPFFQNLVTGPA